MTAKIFYKERSKVKDGDKKPRFRVAAVLDCNLKMFADHFRLSELEAIAAAAGAELVLLLKAERLKRPIDAWDRGQGE